MHSQHSSALTTKIAHLPTPDSLAPLQIALPTGATARKTCCLITSTKANTLLCPSWDVPYSANADHLLPHIRNYTADDQHLSPSSISAPSPSRIAAPSPFGISTSSQITSDDESICSSQSTQLTRQLHPRLPITYNKIALVKLQGRSHIQMLNNVSLPFPSDTDGDQEKSPTAPDSSDEKEITNSPQPDATEVKSPARQWNRK